jgi:hypothetical protein
MKIITECLLTHRIRPHVYSKSQNRNTDIAGVNSGSEKIYIKSQKIKNSLKIVNTNFCAKN